MVRYTFECLDQLKKKTYLDYTRGVIKLWKIKTKAKHLCVFVVDKAKSLSITVVFLFHSNKSLAAILKIFLKKRESNK